MFIRRRPEPLAQNSRNSYRTTRARLPSVLQRRERDEAVSVRCWARFRAYEPFLGGTVQYHGGKAQPWQYTVGIPRQRVTLQVTSISLVCLGNET